MKRGKVVFHNKFRFIFDEKRQSYNSIFRILQDVNNTRTSSSFKFNESWQTKLRLNGAFPPLDWSVDNVMV